MKKLLIKLCLLTFALLGSQAALAGPVRCSVNNQDSSCLTPITTAWQTPATCPTGPGYTTIAAAQWLGSQYSAPQCNYQAPPSCPAGYDQTGPSWNGSAWVGLSCVPHAPQGPGASCSASVPAGYTSSASWTQVQNNVANDAMAQQAGISGYSTLWSLFPTYGPNYSSACGSGNQYNGYCYVRGDNTVAGIIMAETLNFSNGQCNH